MSAPNLKGQLVHEGLEVVAMTTLEEALKALSKQGSDPEPQVQKRPS